MLAVVLGVFRPDRAERLARPTRFSWARRRSRPWRLVRPHRSTRPSRCRSDLPSGVSLGSVGYARIEVSRIPRTTSTSRSIPTAPRCQSRSSCGYQAMRRPCRPQRPPGRSRRFRHWRFSLKTRPRSPPPKSRRPGSRQEPRAKPPKKLHRKAGTGGLNIAKATSAWVRKSPNFPPRSMMRSNGPSDPVIGWDARRFVPMDRSVYRAVIRAGSPSKPAMLISTPIRARFRRTRNPHNPSIFRRFLASFGYHRGKLEPKLKITRGFIEGRAGRGYAWHHEKARRGKMHKEPKFGCGSRRIES